MGRRLHAFTSKHDIRKAFSSRSKDKGKSSANELSSIQRDDRHRTRIRKSLHAIGSKFDICSAFHKGQKEANRAKQEIQTDKPNQVDITIHRNTERKKKFI